MNQQGVVVPAAGAPVAPVYRAHRRFSFQAPSQRDAPAPFEFGTSYGSAARSRNVNGNANAATATAQKPPSAAAVYASRRPSYNGDTSSARAAVVTSATPRVCIVENGVPPLPVNEYSTSGRRRRAFPVSNSGESERSAPNAVRAPLPPTPPDALRPRNGVPRTCHSPDPRVTCCGVTSPRANAMTSPVWPHPSSPEARNDVFAGHTRQQIHP